MIVELTDASSLTEASGYLFIHTEGSICPLLPLTSHAAILIRPFDPYAAVAFLLVTCFPLVLCPL